MKFHLFKQSYSLIKFQLSVFVFVFFYFYFFSETGFLYVAWLSWNSPCRQRSACLCLPCAGIKACTTTCGCVSGVAPFTFLHHCVLYKEEPWDQYKAVSVTREMAASKLEDSNYSPVLCTYAKPGWTGE